MAKIIERKRLAPNIHLLELEAPDVARAARPGQFFMVMPDAKGERIPLTLADWDADRGHISSVFLPVGTSTHKLSLLKAGDEVPVVCGPLGRPSEIAAFGTVLLAGGCFGLAAIYPIARALKAAGNRTLILADVKAAYLMYWEDKLRSASDRFFIASRDGAFQDREFLSRRIEGIVEAEKTVNRIVAVGCTYLMYACAEATRPLGIKTLVNLNPIMVDGTGMCGACRVTVDGKTRFACVDGPDFDGHRIDWAELFARRKSYFDEEIRSLCAWEKDVFP